MQCVEENRPAVKKKRSNPFEQQLKGGGGHVAAEGGGHITDGSDGVKFFDLTSFFRGKNAADTVVDPQLAQFRTHLPGQRISESFGNICPLDL